MLASPIITTPPQLKLSIGCDLASVRPAALQLRDFLAEHNASEEEIMGCELAFVEACNNAVLYASDNRRDLPIQASVTCSEAAIEISIHDHTDGFVLPEKISLPEKEDEGGRGLFIIQSIMEDVSYATSPEGNTLRLVKQREYQTRPGMYQSRSIAEFQRKLTESEQIISEMAEELSSCYETLSAIFRCGAELGKTNNIHSFASSLCSDLIQITESDWYLLRIMDQDGRLIPFACSDAEVIASFTPLDTSESLPAESRAAAARKDVWFNPTSPLRDGDPLQHFGTECFGLVHPILFADNLTGTLTVGKCSGRPRFTAAQSNIVHTFADFLAIQFINAQLQEEQLKHKLVSRELDIAKSIQRALLPKALPQRCGFGLAGYCEFARTVGGDFYDVVPVGSNSLLLIIADVMGKGIPAAMFAAILRSLLRAAPELNRNPDALLGRVNRLLYEELAEVEMFITAQLAFVDLEKREVVAASAGHCPMLLATPTSRQIKAISPDGIPLGILPDAHYEAQVEALPQDARLLFYTDGLTDARNPFGGFFSDERLLAWLNSTPEASTAEQLKESLVDSLHQFQGEAAPFDDQTFLILADENAARRADVSKNFSR